MGISSERKLAYQREYYQKNKLKSIALIKEWAKRNPEKVKEYRDNYRKNTPIETRLWYAIKGRAKAKKVDFNLDLSDIIVPTHCPYLGFELTNIIRQGKVETNPSVDRIDPTKGYVKGNIQVISEKANRMKQNATKEELLTFARSILKQYGD